MISSEKEEYSTFPTRRFQVRRKLHIKSWRCIAVYELKRTNPIARFDRPTITFHKSATVSQTVKQNNRTWVAALIVLEKCLLYVLISHSIITVSLLLIAVVISYLLYLERSVDVEACSQCKVDSSTRGPAVG